MATISGMDYEKMMSLVTYLEEQKGAMVNVLSTLAETAPTRIANAYSGEAAETYKTSLNQVIENIETTLDSIIVQLKTNADQKKADYEAQDKKMQESIVAPINQ